MSEQSAFQHLAKLARAYGQQRTRHVALKSYVESLAQLVDAGKRVSSGMQILDAIAEALAATQAAVAAGSSSLLAMDEDENELVFILTNSDIERTDICWRRFSMDQGVAGWVATHKTPVIVNSPGADPRFLNTFDDEFGFKTESIVAAPLIHKGRVLGVIEFLNKTDRRLFTTTDQTMIHLMADLAGALLSELVENNDPAEVMIEMTTGSLARERDSA